MKNFVRTIFSAVLLGIGICSYAQVLDVGSLIRVNKATQVALDTVTTADTGMIVYNSTTKMIDLFDGTIWKPLNAGSNWNLTGNTGVSGNFFGTTNDFTVQLRANNTPMLELGRRQTLGLYDASPTGLFPYNQQNASVAYIRGTGGVSALQFEASAANFYKPIFFTDIDGNFKMRGSSAGTDFFELGSAGTANSGSLDFVIGDDGDEPMTFRKYNYTTQALVEMLRLQGTGLNTTVRAGIGTRGVVPNSTLQVGGSFATPVNVVSIAVTLSDTNHTVILSNNSAITLPAASTCAGRTYVIKKTSTGTSVISSFLNDLGVASTHLVQGVYSLQSDGTNWQQINTSTFGSNFQLFQNSAVLSTNSTTLQSVINQNTVALAPGVYEITISYLWNYSSANNDFVSEFTFGGNSVTSSAGNVIHQEEPADAGSDQFSSYQKSFYVTLASAGVQNVSLSYRCSAGGATASIWNSAVKVVRVN